MFFYSLGFPSENSKCIIVKSLEKKTANQKSQDFFQMFVISKKKAIP